MEVKLLNDKGERDMYENFVERYAINIITATEKLDKMDSYCGTSRCATMASTSSSASAVAECVQNFFTSMGALKLNMVAVD
ncbi:unnamed protein product [Arabidopsis thaliana]|uniref:(thale cress) hypothetical protein n=1 Tax=Arabidopsis thaliana TaxID=3702 RepID=A0A7G2EKJ6_ARATH|nr:unnamed protein product [Arabidopsis thaliana]